MKSKKTSKAKKASKKVRDGSNKTVTYVLISLICLFAVFPFFWMISTSFKPPGEVFTHNPTFIPYSPTLEGYIHLFTHHTPTFNYLAWVRNSLIVATATSLIGLFIACFSGYGISRYRFKGRLPLAYFILIAQVLPGSLLLISLFMILSELDLLSTYTGLIIMCVTFSIPFCTWMMKGFFDSIPTSLDEAARIDGCNEFSVFWRVILPLTLPGIAVTAFFSFIAGWNEFMFSSIVMREFDMWTLPVGLASFQGQYAIEWTNLMAGAVLTTIPIVVLFLVLQKYLVGGMTAGAVKQ